MADVGRLYIAFFLVFVLYSLYDIGLFSDSSKNEDASLVEINENASPSVPSLKFLFCHSCGYKKTFEDYVRIIVKKYPGISIRGANYDPPGLSIWLARFLNLAKIFFLMAIMFNINPYQLIGSPRAPPSWWIWCSQNKIYACVMCFCATNTIEGFLMSTGAFEISYEGMPIWSKLDTGRIPQPPELFAIIDSLAAFDKYNVQKA